MRSYDWRMPEEKYRTTIDHLSDRIYAYLDSYKEQGINEGIGESRITVTGNPIVDIIFENRHLFIQGADLVEGSINTIVKTEDYVVATCHRRENILGGDSLNSIISLINSVEDRIIFPMGYKTQEQLSKLQIDLSENVHVVDPIGYIEFMYLLENSKYVISDSGTVIEEACILEIPSIQMRKSTERPEVYDVGASVKFDPTRKNDNKKIVSEVIKLVGTKWDNPFGDGTASEKIAQDIKSMYLEDSFHRHDRKDYPFNTDRSYMS
jgi:UDP-N-acetylglucosamine 2-epimerase (non-hydrolysing)